MKKTLCCALRGFLYGVALEYLGGLGLCARLRLGYYALPGLAARKGRRRAAGGGSFRAPVRRGGGAGGGLRRAAVT